MIKRTTDEVLVVERIQESVVQSLDERKREVELMQKELMTMQLEFGRAESNYEAEVSEMELEKQMWEKELDGRKKFVELTKGFEDFMQETKDQTRRIELMAHGELDLDGEKELLEKSQHARTMKLVSKFTRNLLIADAEEQDMVFHQAFQTLRMSMVKDKKYAVKLNPNEVIKVLNGHNSVQIPATLNDFFL
jgi:hypothetical protein